jgi:hypothetical protein
VRKNAEKRNKRSNNGLGITLGSMRREFYVPTHEICRQPDIDQLLQGNTQKRRKSKNSSKFK